jgi:hypothetical protein
VRWSGSLRAGEIIAALERKARNGDSHAARELRAWLSEYPPTDEAIDIADIPAAMRQRLLKRLLAEIEERRRCKWAHSGRHVSHVPFPPAWADPHPAAR